MNWNLEGCTVEGMYMDQYFVRGYVTNSRVKYGGSVQHDLLLDQPVQIGRRVRDSVLLCHTEVTCVVEPSNEQQ